MPVLLFSDNELLINPFKNNDKINDGIKIKSTFYAVNRHHYLLANSFGSKLTIYNLKNIKYDNKNNIQEKYILGTFDIRKIKALKISDNGRYILVMTFNKKLIIITKNNKKDKKFILDMTCETKEVVNGDINKLEGVGNKNSSDNSISSIETCNTSNLFYILKEINDVNFEMFGICNDFFYYLKEKLYFNNFEIDYLIVDKPDYILSTTTTSESTKSLKRSFKNEKNENLKKCYDGNYVVYSTIKKGVEKQSLFLVAKDYSKLLFQLKRCFQFKVEEQFNNILLQIETEYSSVTYFANLSIYFIKLHKGLNNTKPITEETTEKITEEITEKIKGTPITPKKDTPITSKKERATISQIIKSDGFFTIYVYNKFPSVLQSGFTSDSFFVNFGEQPSNLCEFSLENGELINRHKKLIRNFVEFTKNKSRILCAAYGNHPGIIHVINNKEIVTKFEVLASSVFKWLLDGSRLIVGITDYMKENNSASLYDYYGNLIKKLSFKSLKKIEIYGDCDDEDSDCNTFLGDSEDDDDDFKKMEYKRPTTLNILKEPEPWNFDDLLKKTNSNYTGLPNDVIKKKPRSLKTAAISTKPIKKIRTKEIIEKEISNAKEFKKRMQSGEDLGLEDQNLVFNLWKLEEELENLLKK